MGIKPKDKNQNTMIEKITILHFQASEQKRKPECIIFIFLDSSLDVTQAKLLP
jgi:hypothetical protein